jgi:hypothetical protein
MKIELQSETPRLPNNSRVNPTRHVRGKKRVKLSYLELGGIQYAHNTSKINRQIKDKSKTCH